MQISAIDNWQDYIRAIGTGALRDRQLETRIVAPTGIEDLDEVLGGGLRRGTLTVLSGLPAVGTSVLATQIAFSAAKHGSSSVMISPHPADQVLNRVAAAEARVPLNHIMNDHLAGDDLPRLQDADVRHGEARLRVLNDEHRLLTAQERLEQIEASAVASRADVIVIDGTSCTEPENRSFALGLRQLAVRRAFACVITSQQRAWQIHGGSWPPLDDLVEYEAFADTADVILMLQREDHISSDDKRLGEAQLAVRKNRFGPSRVVDVSFQGHYARFVEAISDSP